MTYEETITYLYNRLPMFSHSGSSALKTGLGNITKLCEALENPQNKFKSIHIAGTNGKGSSSNMLAAILQQNGYKTGLYTSPHLFDFGERIRVNGQMINRNFVIEFTEKTRSICDAIEPSFFELTVAMAFEYFAQQKVDVAVIETGLGGRLDSTNIITPVLSIITNIGFDHMQILGNTLTEIAAEKAGIIKKDIPVVIGDCNSETKKVFEKKAREMDAEIIIAQEQFNATGISSNEKGLQCSIINLQTKKTITLISDLSGYYQAQNISTVLAAVECLRKQHFNISNEKLLESLQQVKKITGLRGRWEVIQNHPTVIIDVAHNEDGIKQVITQLNIQYPNAQLHFIMGFAKDKDVNMLLELFPKNAHYYFTQAHLPRALPHAELQKMAFEKGLHGNSFENVNEAIDETLNKASKNDVIMICGSFFVIAEINCLENLK